MKSEYEKALETIHDVGEAKETFGLHEEKHNTVLDFICRGVMRYPNDDAQSMLHLAKTKLNLFFENASEEEISWVFSHGQESRGFFQNYVDPMNSENKGKKIGLITWLNSPTTMESSSKDISLLNGIIAAISYAAFDSQTQYSKLDPKTGTHSIHDCNEIKKKCASLMSQSPYVGAYLPERNQAIIKEGWKEKRLKQSESLSELNLTQAAAAPKRWVSKASVDEEAFYMSTTPEIEATRRLFDTNTPYAALAAKRNRLVGHYSANTTSALFILNELIKLGTPKENSGDCVLSENEAKTFAGLIAAEYHRSAFHSPEEVYLGMQPYLEKIKLEEKQLSKGEFEKHLEQTIPNLLPKNEEELTALTKNAIEMMGATSITSIKNAIHSAALEIANDPAKEMPEIEPPLLNDVKKDFADRFKGQRLDIKDMKKDKEPNVQELSTLSAEKKEPSSLSKQTLSDLKDDKENVSSMKPRY